MIREIVIVKSRRVKVEKEIFREFGWVLYGFSWILGI